MSKNEGIKILSAILVSIYALKKSIGGSTSVYKQGSGRAKYSKEQKEKIKEYIGDHWSQSFEQLESKVADWVPPLDPNKFYITSSMPIKKFYDMTIVHQLSGSKPVFKSSKALNEFGTTIESRAPVWFAPGREWIDWMIYNMPIWMYGTNYIYEIELDWSKIAKTTERFEQRYLDRASYGYFGPKLDWKSIVEDYSGVYGDDHLIGNWDIPSGCVWDWEAIRGITLVAQKPGSNPAPKIVTFGGSFNILDDQSVMQKAPLTKEGYKKALKKYKKGGEQALGYTERSSLKALGLIPRADGTYKVSKKYK